MNFQTRSNTGREKEQKWSLTDGKREQGKREEGKREKGGAFYYKQGVERHAWRRAGGAGMQAEPSGSWAGLPGFVSGTLAVSKLSCAGVRWRCEKSGFKTV